MKIDQAGLESGAFLPSAVKPMEERAATPDQVTVHYNHNKATLFQEEDVQAYGLERGTYLYEYITSLNFRIVATLQDALKARHVGQKVVTLREADIASRSRLDLNKPIIWDSLCLMDSFLCEGTPGDPESPWELRAAYNRGLEWKKTEFKKVSEARQKAGTDRLEYLKTALAKCELPLWPEELERGFHMDLLKPEWQTWGQYQEERKRQRRVVA